MLQLELLSWSPLNTFVLYDNVANNATTAVTVRENLKTYTLPAGVLDVETFVHSLYDHLHWLLLLSGYLIADAGTGEKPLIPEAFRSQSDGDYPIAIMVTAVLQLLDFLSNDKAVAHRHLLSPLMTETIFWFLERWSKSYLFADIDGDYEKGLPSNLVAAFGTQSAQAQQKLEFTLEQCQRNLMIWSGEVEVILSIIKLLNVLATNEHTRARLLVSQRWHTLVQFVIEHISALPGETHNSLIAALTRAGNGASTPEQKQAYFGAIFGIVEVSFTTVYILEF